MALLEVRLFGLVPLLHLLRLLSVTLFGLLLAFLRDIVLLIALVFFFLLRLQFLALLLLSLRQLVLLLLVFRVVLCVTRRRVG
jgi:hypothetical protein